MPAWKLSAQQIAFFDTFGFLALPGLLRDRIGEITEDFAAVWKSRGGGHAGKPHEGKVRSCLFPFIDHSERLCSLLDDPRIEGAAASFLGDDFNYLGSDGNYYTGDTAWHSDGWNPPEHLHLKIAFYLDPLTRDTGALRVIPGSHNIADRFAQALQATAEGAFCKTEQAWGIAGREMPAFALEVTPGDIVMFNHNTKHASFGGGGWRRMFTLNLGQRCGPDRIPALRNYINWHAGFWIDRLYGDTMVRTATPGRMRHLEQVMANDDELAGLSQKARNDARAIARGLSISSYGEPRSRRRAHCNHRDPSDRPRYAPPREQGIASLRKMFLLCRLRLDLISTGERFLLFPITVPSSEKESFDMSNQVENHFYRRIAMKLSKPAALVAVMIGVLGLNMAAQADLIYFDYSGQNGDILGGNYSLGSEFTVGASDAAITKVGQYWQTPAFGATMNTDANVELWTTGGTLLMNWIIPAGAAVSPDQFAWMDITPYPLNTGTTYVISSFGENYPFGFFDFSPDLGTFPTTDITYVGRAADTSGADVFPGGAGIDTTHNATNVDFGASFQYDVPEPASMTLLALGGVMLLKRRRI